MQEQLRRPALSCFGIWLDFCRLCCYPSLAAATNPSKHGIPPSHVPLFCKLSQRSYGLSGRLPFAAQTDRQAAMSQKQAGRAGVEDGSLCSQAA